MFQLLGIQPYEKGAFGAENQIKHRDQKVPVALSLHGQRQTVKVEQGVKNFSLLPHSVKSRADSP